MRRPSTNSETNTASMQSRSRNAASTFETESSTSGSLDSAVATSSSEIVTLRSSARNGSRRLMKGAR
jgi:hypothetical protein